MYRYFHLYENEQVAAIDIVDVSPAATAPVSEFEKLFSAKLKEIDKKQYKKLVREYDRKIFELHQ